MDKRRDERKKSSRVVFAVLFLLLLYVFVLPEEAAADSTCEYLHGNNLNAQDYSKWANPVESYLVPRGDGYMRLQAGAGEGIVAVYYDADFNRVSRKGISAELPLFGGFYESGSCYFLVTGQRNPDEKDDCEVYRITKYDKNWNKLGECGLNGANTTEPFKAGSCRMDMDGKYLLIRTCHEMYLNSDDGYHHQANVTIEVNTDTMTVTDSFYGVMNDSVGYVSHSFNQFIKLENHHIAAIDHGDARPRSICLMEYPTDVTTGKFQVDPFGDPVVTTSVLDLYGETGANTTNASVGGFELSGSHYLVAGNSVLQDGSQNYSYPRNVFVAAVDKATKEVSFRWLTDVSGSQEGCSTPHLVKISATRFMALWTRGKKVEYVLLDGSGNTLGQTYSLTGALSDCQPLVRDGHVIWYTWKNGEEIFYDIPWQDLGTPTVQTKNFDHEYQWLGTENGLATFRCGKCHREITGKVPTGFTPFFRDSASDDDYYYSYFPEVSVGSKVSYMVSYLSYSAESDKTFDQFSVECDDPGCVIDMDKETISFTKGGNYKIRIYPTYNPAKAEEVNVNVKGPLTSVSLQANKASPQSFGQSVRLTAETVGGQGTLQYDFVCQDENGNRTSIGSAGTDNTRTWTPEKAGAYTLFVTVTDSEGGAMVISEGLAFTVTRAEVKLKPGQSVRATNQIEYGKKLKDITLSQPAFVTVQGGEDRQRNRQLPCA